MIKNIFVIIMFIFLLCIAPVYSNATELPEEMLEKDLIILLQGPILSVVGVDWFRGDEKILEIRQDMQDKDTPNVKVQVVTFQGPHNPPYLQEIITFSINKNEIRPIDYFNRLIPESEYENFNIP